MQWRLSGQTIFSSSAANLSRWLLRKTPTASFRRPIRRPYLPVAVFYAGKPAPPHHYRTLAPRNWRIFDTKIQRQHRFLIAHAFHPPDSSSTLHLPWRLSDCCREIIRGRLKSILSDGLFTVTAYLRVFFGTRFWLSAWPSGLFSLPWPAFAYPPPT